MTTGASDLLTDSRGAEDAERVSPWRESEPALVLRPIAPRRGGPSAPVLRFVPFLRRENGEPDLLDRTVIGNFLYSERDLSKINPASGHDLPRREAVPQKLVKRALGGCVHANAIELFQIPRSAPGFR